MIVQAYEKLHSVQIKFLSGSVKLNASPIFEPPHISGTIPNIQTDFQPPEEAISKVFVPLSTYYCQIREMVL